MEQIPSDHVLQYHISSLNGNGIHALANEIMRQSRLGVKNTILISTHKQGINEEDIVKALGSQGANKEQIEAVFPKGIGNYFINREEILKNKEQEIDPDIEI